MTPLESFAIQIVHVLTVRDVPVACYDTLCKDKKKVSGHIVDQPVKSFATLRGSAAICM